MKLFITTFAMSLVLLGLLLTGSDGPLFPVVNIAGLIFFAVGGCALHLLRDTP